MDSPTLRQLEYAVAVADSGHFGRAAELVHVSQPGLATQIKELEKRLGVELFERTSRGVLVTSAGADVIDRARMILAAVNDLGSVAGAHQGRIAGTIRLGAIPTIAPYLLTKLLLNLPLLILTQQAVIDKNSGKPVWNCFVQQHRHDR